MSDEMKHAAEQAEQPRVRWVRHKKRGTLYRVLGRGQLQASWSMTDEAPLIIYQGEDGALWARDPDEFEDGRFEDTPNPTPEQPRDVGEMVTALPGGGETSNHRWIKRKVSGTVVVACARCGTLRRLCLRKRCQGEPNPSSTLPPSPGAEAIEALCQRIERLYSEPVDGGGEGLALPMTLREAVNALRALSTTQDGAGEVEKLRGADGWFFLNPDTGTEWSEQHPVQSGEVPDAEDIRPATLANAMAELRSAWEMLDEERKHRAALTTPAARGETPPGASTEPAYEMQEGEGEVERLREALAREQSVCVEVMRERDNAEEAIGGLFREVMGRPPEWSSVFGYADALEEVADTMATLRAGLTTPAAPEEEARHG